MKPEWTLQQRNAIEARGRNILVSAAAGSGKTAVLAERVTKLVTDINNPVDIDRLLIVTFTNAAAAEMKSRISQLLNQLIKSNPDIEYYKKQFTLLQSADICTIDAFCMKLVKEYFYELNISQDIAIMDESELSMLQDSVIVEVIDEMFESGNDSFKKLLDSYTSPGNDKPIINLVKSILRFIYAQPFPYYWLKDAIENSNPDNIFEETLWYKYIKSEINELIDYALSLAEKNISIAKGYYDEFPAFIELFEEDKNIIKSIKEKLNDDWNEFISAAERISFGKLPRTTKLDLIDSNKIKNNRDTYKSVITKDIKAFSVSDREDYTDDMKKLYPQLIALYQLVSEVDKRLYEEKRDRNSYSFSDIEHFAIKLLFRIDDKGEVIKTEIADTLSEKYYEILVDEYQDTNEAQDLLFRYLSNGHNLFTVGDIKQSIYRFRLAMPDIFNNKRKEYSNYNKDDFAKSSKIILDKNFRSRKGICDYVNFIFSNIMSERAGEIDYNEEEYLYCGANYPENNLDSAYISILDNNYGDGADIKEAQYIARLIKNKVENKELVKDGDTLRPVRYGDFAILMRSLRKYVSNLAEILRNNAIPVVCDNSLNLFENSEIKMIMSLLRAVNNPTNSIALLATMISPFYGFTADELASIKVEADNKNFYKAVFSCENRKVKAFVDDLKDLKKISVTMSVSAFIRYLIIDKGFVAFINALGNGEQRYQNITELIKLAAKFDSGTSVGLTAFVRYIDKIIASERQIDSASLSAGSTDAVTIMSVHHSKGLEFPICILAGASRKYNKSDLSDTLLMNTKLGIAIKQYDSKGMFRYKTIPYTVIADKNNNELMSENLRVLYVAMTRAKEQFIAVISQQNLKTRLKSLSKYIDDNRINPYSVKKITNDGDLFLLCAMLHPDGEVLRQLTETNYSSQDVQFRLNIDITESIEDVIENDIELKSKPDPKLVEMINKKLTFSYDRKALESLSSKLTASSLDDSENNFEFLTSSKPAFLNKLKLTPAQRGTAMHNFMQYADFNNAERNLNDEIERCVELGFITNEQAECLDKGKLHTFFEGELYSRIKHAEKVYREIKISDFVKASDIYDTEFDDKVLIQGIADCVFEEDGKLVLVDYKTDSVDNEEELLSRYVKQISFYKTTIAKTLKKEVSQTLLYSFSLNKCCYYK